MEWYRQVKAGDEVTPNPLWNQTERPPCRLAPVVPVLEVKDAISQSSVMFKVRLVGGQESWLDAGWFSGKVQQQVAFDL